MMAETIWKCNARGGVWLYFPNSRKIHLWVAKFIHRGRPHPPLPYYTTTTPFCLPCLPRGAPLTSSWKSAFRFATTICQPSREAGRQACNQPAGRPRSSSSSFKWRANEEEPWNWLLTLREEEEEEASKQKKQASRRSKRAERRADLTYT